MRWAPSLCIMTQNFQTHLMFEFEIHVAPISCSGSRVYLSWYCLGPKCLRTLDLQRESPPKFYSNERLLLLLSWQMLKWIQESCRHWRKWLINADTGDQLCNYNACLIYVAFFSPLLLVFLSVSDSLLFLSFLFF